MRQHDRVLNCSTAQFVGGAEIYLERIVRGLGGRFQMSVLANRRLLNRIDGPVAKCELSRFPRLVEMNIRGGYRLKEIYYYLRHRSLFQPDKTDLIHFHFTTRISFVSSRHDSKDTAYRAS